MPSTIFNDDAGDDKHDKDEELVVEEAQVADSDGNVEKDMDGDEVTDYDDNNDDDDDVVMMVVICGDDDDHQGSRTDRQSCSRFEAVIWRLKRGRAKLRIRKRLTQAS